MQALSTISSERKSADITCVIRSNGAPGRNDAHYALHYGNAHAALIRVVPDALWPGMWRIVRHDGLLSDMVNRDRAKDAAAAIAERGPPARNRRRFHWKQERSKTRRGAPPMHQSPPSLLWAGR